MSDLDIPIMVVDHAQFSSATITKVLRSGGFTNMQFTNNPREALRSLEKRPVQLVLADWRMPTMDGLELTKRIRMLDANQDHFTYTILMMSQDETEPLEQALDLGVNDFLNKANIRTQLLPLSLIHI